MEKFSTDYYLMMIQKRNHLAKELSQQIIVKKSRCKTKTLKQLIADADTTEEVEHILKTFGIKE